MGVVIDSRLSLSEQVASVCRSGYYQLRQLRQAVRCSSMDATKTMAQAFITSRLDSCNALYNGISNELMRRLQSVQNAAVRLMTGTRRCDYITPVLRQLHWLPVGQRVDFKIVTLVHRSLSGHIPSYLADDCRLITDARARRLRSADTRTLAVGRTRRTISATEHLLPRHHGCGTVCHPSCGNPNCHIYNLGVHLRHFYLGSSVTGAV